MKRIVNIQVGDIAGNTGLVIGGGHVTVNGQSSGEEDAGGNDGVPPGDDE